MYDDKFGWGGGWRRDEPRGIWRRAFKHSPTATDETVFTRLSVVRFVFGRIIRFFRVVSKRTGNKNRVPRVTVRGRVDVFVR